MDEFNFSILVGFLIIFAVGLLIVWRYPDWLEERLNPTPGEQVADFLKVLLIAGGAVGVFAISINVVGPSIYRPLLRENPLLLARVSLVSVALLVFIALLSIGKELFTRGYYERLRSRIDNAQYLDEKLREVLLALFLIGVGIIYLSLPILMLYGILTNWDNMDLWSKTIVEMQTSASTPAPASTDPLPLALSARRDTCLYAEPDLSGSCALTQEAKTLVLPYISLEPDLERKRLIREQKGPVIYVVSLAPPTVLQSGWARQSDYVRLDLLEGFLATFNTLFSPEVIKSALIDLVIGSVISLIIVAITQGAAEHYLLSLVFLCSMVSTALRFSIGGQLIVPPWVLWLAIIPIALGAVLEEGLIKLLRRFGR